MEGVMKSTYVDSREPWDNNGSEADRWYEDYCKGEFAMMAILWPSYWEEQDD